MGGKDRKLTINQSSGCLPFMPGRRSFTYHVTIAKDKVRVTFTKQQTCFLLPVSFLCIRNSCRYVKIGVSA